MRRVQVVQCTCGAMADVSAYRLANFISSLSLSLSLSSLARSRCFAEAPSASAPSASQQQPATAAATLLAIRRLWRIFLNRASSFVTEFERRRNGKESGGGSVEWRRCGWKSNGMRERMNEQAREKERGTEEDPAGIGNAKCTCVYPRPRPPEILKVSLRDTGPVSILRHCSPTLPVLPREYVPGYVAVPILKVACGTTNLPASGCCFTMSVSRLRTR